MPFQAVIESARNIEADLGEDQSEVWRVVDERTKDGLTALSLVRADKAPEMVLMPTGLRDGRDDVFYPNLEVEGSVPRETHDFQHPDGRLYRLAGTLKRGDGVRVHPSRVMTVFLDGASGRFESVRKSYVSDFRRMRAVWDLLAMSVPSASSLRAVWMELDASRRAWQNVEGEWLPGGEEEWARLVRAMFSSRLGMHGAALEELTEAARHGILDWAIEWHMRWLKKGVEE
jgi:hypothetical protein